MISTQVRAAPRWLEAAAIYNLPIALDAANGLDDMRIAADSLDEAEEFFGASRVAVLADAGGGKTQMAAQLTAPQPSRPAGILLHGRVFHRGQTLDESSSPFYGQRRTCGEF